MRGRGISGIKTVLSLNKAAYLWASQNKIRAQSWAGLCCKGCGNFVEQKYEHIVEYYFEREKVKSTFYETILCIKLVRSNFAMAMSGTWSCNDYLLVWFLKE